MHSETDEQTPSARAHITPWTACRWGNGERDVKGNAAGTLADGVLTDRITHTAQKAADAPIQRTDRFMAPPSAVTRRQLHTCLPRKFLAHWDYTLMPKPKSVRY